MDNQAATRSGEDFTTELSWPPAHVDDSIALSPEPFGGALRQAPAVPPHDKGAARWVALTAAACAVIAATTILTLGQIGVPASRASAATSPETVALGALGPVTASPSMKRDDPNTKAELAEGLDALRARMQAAARDADPAPAISLASIEGPEVSELSTSPVVTGATPAPIPVSPLAEVAASRPGPAVAEIGATLERMRGLIAAGDIAAARRLAEYAAAGGDGAALLALAETYDPAQLARWRVRGIRPDADRARALYTQALARGVTGASDRLARLP